MVYSSKGLSDSDLPVLKPWSFIDVLEWEIFEGVRPSIQYIKGKENPGFYPISVYNRDIFHDAFPSDTEKPNQPILGSDFITPHNEVFQDPNPIMFLKLLPGTQINFQFDLKDGLL